MALGRGSSALFDARCERCRGRNAVFADGSEQGNRDCGIGHHAQINVKQALVIHRPARNLQVTKTDVDPFTARGHKAGQDAGGTHQFSRGLFPVAGIEAEQQIGIAKNIFVHAHIERMAAWEIEAAVDIKHRSTHGFGERHEIIETIGMAANVLGEYHRVFGLQEHIGHAFERRRIRGDGRGHAHGAHGRQWHIVREWRLLQPRVVAHVNGPLRLGHHYAVGTRERLRHAIDRGGLVIPFGVVAHRLALHVCGVGPVDARAALGFIHGPGGTDDKHRRTVDISVVHRHIAMQQPH